MPFGARHFRTQITHDVSYWRLSSTGGGRFQVLIVDVAKSHDLLVLDVAVVDVTAPHSSGGEDGNPQVLTD